MVYQVNNSVPFSGKPIGSVEFFNQIVEALGVIIDRCSKEIGCAYFILLLFYFNIMLHLKKYFQILKINIIEKTQPQHKK